MTAIHIGLGLLTTLVTLATAAWGAWRWWRVEPSPLFWRLLRAAQGLLVVEALVGGVLLLMGEDPADSLHYVYGLTPLLVSFAAEGLRIGAAETVLEARGLANAQAMKGLAEDVQRSIVLQILRRELGVMTIAAWVMFGLEARAALGA